MRSLAIARFRLLTTIRKATPLFVLAFWAALGPLVLTSPLSDGSFRADADSLLGTAATAAVFAWIAHALLLVVVCDAFGRDSSLRTQLASQETDGPADLMDTAPIGLRARFWGEAAGILAAAMIIHLCTLPLLVLGAALSPLPTSMFLVGEAVTIALVVLASAGAAWKRRAPRTKWSATRGPRSALLFVLILLVSIRQTTQWEVFRDSFVDFVRQPTPHAWSTVFHAVENPFLLCVLLLSLYYGYLAFYYSSSVRMARR